MCVYNTVIGYLLYSPLHNTYIYIYICAETFGKIDLSPPLYCFFNDNNIVRNPPRIDRRRRPVMCQLKFNALFSFFFCHHTIIAVWYFFFFFFFYLFSLRLLLSCRIFLFETIAITTN